MAHLVSLLLLVNFSLALAPSCKLEVQERLVCGLEQDPQLASPVFLQDFVYLLKV